MDGIFRYELVHSDTVSFLYIKEIFIVGKSSCEIESAEKLDKHIVVFGATPSELILFISGQ